MEDSQAPTAASEEEASVDTEGRTEGSLLNQLDETLQTLRDLDKERHERMDDLGEIRAKIWDLIGPPPMQHMTSSTDGERPGRFMAEAQEAPTVPLDRIKLAQVETKLTAISRICGSSAGDSSKVAAIQAIFR